jgi:hypothetical protein
MPFLGAFLLSGINYLGGIPVLDEEEVTKLRAIFGASQEQRPAHRMETFIHRIRERLNDFIRKKAIVERVKPPQKGEVRFIRTPPSPNKTSY